MLWIKIKKTLRKIIPPSRFCFDRREELLAGLIRDLKETILGEIRSRQAEDRSLRERDLAGIADGIRKEMQALRERDLAGIADGIRKEMQALRERDLAGILDRINLFMSQFDFYFKHICKNELEETIDRGVIPLRFYRNIDPTKRNWGDELNVNFFEAVSGGKVKVIRTLDKNNTDFNILSIGSTLSDLNWGSVVWGAGLISEDFKPISHPVEVRAVRGPLTRKVLREGGIDCPAVYGDPALLLPLFYQPVSRKTRSQVTVVPHYVDADSEVVAKWRGKDNFHVVDMKDYSDWRDVVDAIVNSEFVISSSLHGLVVAEAYGIPSLWVEFSDRILGRWFKYRDFYESIGKKGMKPVRIDSPLNLEDLSSFMKQWQKGSINLEPLLKSCPFPIINAVNIKCE